MKHITLYEKFLNDLNESYVAQFAVEDGSSHTAKEWKNIVDRLNIKDVSASITDSSYKHHKAVRIKAPNRRDVKKIIKALNDAGIEWADAEAFQ